ncbi:hypothetical protein D1AOALGA4SA_2593 [Olavius algarvensis Delta 1 endosymbiont]|nr:hypothetical protein D1AOALGA4SA_2593 [Olavius algarvensis Delta 1 endosymbiont]
MRIFTFMRPLYRSRQSHAAANPKKLRCRMRLSITGSVTKGGGGGR